ncbi:hypothetical protein Tco_0268238 [Tanacetum coccineum]
MWLMWIVMGLYIATDEASSPFCLALHFFQSSPHDFPIIGSSSMVRRITTVGHMDCQLAILDVDTLCSYTFLALNLRKPSRFIHGKSAKKKDEQ